MNIVALDDSDATYVHWQGMRLKDTDIPMHETATQMHDR